MSCTDPIEIEPDAWCEWCGDPLPETEDRHHSRRYCSVKCRSAAAYDPIRQARAAMRPERACGHCGTTFKAKGPAHRYCGISCQFKARYRRETGRPEGPFPAKACIQCGAEFTPANPGHKYCTPACKVLALRARGRDAAG